MEATFLRDDDSGPLVNPHDPRMMKARHTSGPILTDQVRIVFLEVVDPLADIDHSQVPQVAWYTSPQLRH